MLPREARFVNAKPALQAADVLRLAAGYFGFRHLAIPASVLQVSGGFCRNVSE